MWESKLWSQPFKQLTDYFSSLFHWMTCIAHQWCSLWGFALYDLGEEAHWCRWSQCYSGADDHSADADDHSAIQVHSDIHCSSRSDGNSCYVHYLQLKSKVCSGWTDRGYITNVQLSATICDSPAMCIGRHSASECHSLSRACCIVSQTGLELSTCKIYVLQNHNSTDSI